jgi:hypothetical protein
MADLTDEELAWANATAEAAVARRTIAIHAPHLVRSLGVVEALLVRRPELGAGEDVEQCLAFAAKVRSDGLPPEPADAQLTFLRELAARLVQCANLFGSIAWNSGRTEPSDPLHRAVLGLRRRHRKNREDERRSQLGRIEMQIERLQADRAAHPEAGAEIDRLQAEKSRIAALDVIKLCCDRFAL